MQIFENSFLEVKKGTDKVMLGATVLLFIIGVAAIYSAGYSPVNNNSPYALRQVVFGVFGFMSYYFMIKIGYKSILKMAIPLSCLTIVVFLLLLVIGHTSKGAQSWFNFGFIRLQPSELGKIVFAITLARFCEMVSPDSIKGIILVFIVALLFIIPIILQPDLGSALVYSVMLFALLIIGGASSKLLIGIICTGFAMLPAGWLMLKPYQKMRIRVFIDPSIDPQGAGYNVIQSRIAVGSGGFFGKGFLNGTQSKLHFLPEPHTDFIFGVFSEEFGFCGCIIVLILFLLLLWRILSVSAKTREPGARMLCIMIAAWIWFQMTESIAMCMGLAPVTGLPLPLFSYGGSALVSVLIGLALVQSVAVTLAKERF